MKDKQLSIAITGAGGAGVISCGELLLRAWAGEGGRGLLRKAFGPQIRGGEAAALLKLTDNEQYTAVQVYDVVVALDWANFSRFEDEVQLSAETFVLCEPDTPLPDAVAACGARVLTVPFARLAAEAHAEGRVNMWLLGMLGQLLALPQESLAALAEQKLQSKPAAYREAAVACIAAGAGHAIDCPLAAPAREATGAWVISGNQAAGFGALTAGVRFVAAYPITPASDVLEWMVDGLEQVGGHLVQAEDELAAINMVLGAAFGGVPALTATSGPGLALMTESLGLAVASEIPVCVLNVMRGGPSTGIPTKSEQGDLSIALHGLHGDAPHLVLAPLDIADCVFTTGWAVKLAQHLQTAAIVLSDQFLGQSTAVVSAPRRCEWEPPAPAATDDIDFLRYRLTDSGVSTLAFPGEPDRRYTADGLEHNERGTPSAGETDHRRQLDKRLTKLTGFDFGDDWARINGDGAVVLLAFGSAASAIEEVAGLLDAAGIEVTTVALRLLAPLPVAALAALLADRRHLIVVEQNHGAQLCHYLRSELELPPWSSYAVPGPVPLSADAIARFTMEVLAA